MPAPTPPDGFDDLTDYTFRSADGRRRLTVQTAAAGRPPGEALASFLTRLLGRPGPGPATVEWVGVAVGGALTVRYTFAEEVTAGDGRQVRRVRESCGFARLGDGTGVTLGYARPADAADEDVCDRMLGSVGPAGPPAVGFARRVVGRVAVDVPADLTPPTAYLFATPAADIRLSARVAAAGEPDPPAAYGSLAHPPSGAAVREVGVYQVAGGDRMTMCEATTPGAAGPRTDFVCYGVVARPEGDHVALSGHCRADRTGPPAAARVDDMVRAFDTLATSLKGGPTS